MTTAATERPHGYARYKLDGCRCYTCGWAVAQYNDTRNRGLMYGTWQPFTDAEPVRAHIEALRAAGIGRRRIAELSGVSEGAVIKLLYGHPSSGRAPSAKVRTETASRLLAVRPGMNSLAGHGIVGANGTVRRLRALVANGWPQAQLAGRLGMTPANFGTLMRQQQVTAEKARVIAELYVKIQNTDPRAEGVGPQAYTRALNQGVRNRWARPAHWDDEVLDDPAAFPNWTGACGTARGYGRHRADGIPMCSPCTRARAESRSGTSAGAA